MRKIHITTLELNGCGLSLVDEITKDSNGNEIIRCIVDRDCGDGKYILRANNSYDGLITAVIRDSEVIIG